MFVFPVRFHLQSSADEDTENKPAGPAPLGGPISRAPGRDTQLPAERVDEDALEARRPQKRSALLGAARCLLRRGHVSVSLERQASDLGRESGVFERRAGWSSAPAGLAGGGAGEAEGVAPGWGRARPGLRETSEHGVDGDGRAPGLISPASQRSYL